MKIVTHYDMKPIPLRQWDWVAYDDSTYDGEGCPLGYGRTEQEAIADLIAQIDDPDTYDAMIRIHGASSGS